MFNGIDLSSDTATKPTQAMLEAMMTAEVGDEQKGEDPTTNTLEALVADKLGFNNAIFLPSATMANQIAIQCLCNPGDQLFAASSSHLFQAESGGPAIHAKVMCKPIFTTSGIYTADEVKEECLQTKSLKQTSPKLLSVENTFNFSGGTVWNKKQLQEIIQCAKELQLKTHLDGARLFNASIKTGVSAKDICSDFDTVTVCLSKGLGCPIGALLAYNKMHEEKIRHLKNLMGGAMRQSGILAAAGIYSFEHNIKRLAEDHTNAALLANGLSGISGIKVLNPEPETNMVLFQWISTEISINEFHQKCVKMGVRFSEISNNRFRAVTHLDISESDIHRTVEIIKTIVQKI